MFKKIKEKTTNTFNNKTKDSIENVRGLKKDVKSRFSNILMGRKFHQSSFESDFELVLDAWGLTENQISEVCKDLTNRTYLYGILLVIAIILFAQAFYFLALLLCFCAFLGISTTLWRVYILKNKQFLPFPKYLLLFFGLKKSSEG